MNIQPFLERSSARHSHLCPRQVLGVRIGLLASQVFNFPAGENPKKRILTFVESDGCFSDGVEVATGCTLGHRTLRLQDYGKIAAVFVDTNTGDSIRIAPRLDVREQGLTCCPAENRHYFAQLQAYQALPDEELLTMQQVKLSIHIREIISRPGIRVNCAVCGEKIINEREVTRNGQSLCQTCAGEGYYLPGAQSIHNYITFQPLSLDAK